MGIGKPKFEKPRCVSSRSFLKNHLCEFCRDYGLEYKKIPMLFRRFSRTGLVESMKPVLAKISTETSEKALRNYVIHGILACTPVANTALFHASRLHKRSFYGPQFCVLSCRIETCASRALASVRSIFRATFALFCRLVATKYSSSPIQIATGNALWDNFLECQKTIVSRQLFRSDFRSGLPRDAPVVLAPERFIAAQHASCRQ